MFKKLLRGKAQQYSGQKDFLEAVCAGIALSVYVDGKAEDHEIDAGMKAVMANATLTDSFNVREIEQCMDAMLTRAQGGRTGRNGLYREIDDVASDPDKSEAVMLAILDVVESDGEIDDKEMALLESLGKRLSIDIKKLMEV